MINAFTSTINAINRKNDKFRIATFSVHEGFQVEMAKTGDEYIHVESPEGKKWDFDYREMPKNIVEMTREQFFKTDKVDLLVSHTLPQKELCCALSKDFNIPHISLMHCYPNEKWSKRAIKEIKQRLVADYEIYTTLDQCYNWGGNPNVVGTYIIPHGIDINIFNAKNKQATPVVLTVGNYYKERSSELGFDRYSKIRSMFSSSLRFVHVGKSSDGWSKPASDVNELAEVYKTAGIFLNTCHRSVLPTTMLEAMACGLPIVSYPNPTIKEIIDVNKCGIVVNNETEAASAIEKFLSDKDFHETISNNCIKFVEKYYNSDIFINNWKNLYREATIK